jgi:hypothetical protein
MNRFLNVLFPSTKDVARDGLPGLDSCVRSKIWPPPPEFFSAGASRRRRERPPADQPERTLGHLVSPDYWAAFSTPHGSSLAQRQPLCSGSTSGAHTPGGPARHRAYSARERTAGHHHRRRPAGGPDPFTYLL